MASDGGGSGDLSGCLELLRTLGSTAVDDAALLSFREAADFADKVEEISRAAEYLQIVAAGAVTEPAGGHGGCALSRSRLGLGSGWGSAGSGVGGGRLGHRMGHGMGGKRNLPIAAAATNPADSDPADDGYRNAADFLRTSVRISKAEANRRLSPRRRRSSPGPESPGTSRRRRARARPGP